MTDLERLLKTIANKRGAYLKAKIARIPFFPLSVRSDKGSVTDDFSLREQQLAQLYAKSKAKTGHGYLLVTETRESRSMGRQTVIRDIVVETEDDFLHLLGEMENGRAFSRNLGLLRKTFPEEGLEPWLQARKMQLYRNLDEEDGATLCAVARFLADHPDSDLFARELPVEAPSKFLETHLALTRSLVAAIRPLADGDDDYGRLGLRRKESWVKIRSSVPFSLRLQDEECGTTDALMLSRRAFSTFSCPARRIFVVENETVFLTFPLGSADLCIYGGGYGILAFGNSLLLSGKPIYYFGDLDRHGFAILDRFRTLYPQTRSFCMDRQTLAAYRKFCIGAKPFSGSYRNLDGEELATIAELGDRLLEQEHIPLSYLKSRSNNLPNG